MQMDALSRGRDKESEADVRAGLESQGRRNPTYNRIYQAVRRESARERTPTARAHTGAQLSAPGAAPAGRARAREKYLVLENYLPNII